MKQSAIPLFGLALGLALLHHAAAPAQEKLPFPEPPPPKVIPELPPFSKFSKTPEIIQRLHTEVDTAEFQIFMQLDEALELLSEMLEARKKEVDFFFDEPTFKAEMPKERFEPFTLKPPEPKEEPPGILETLVRLPDLPKKMTAANVLKTLLSQLPQHKGTYLIRDGMVFITTKNRAGIKNLLQEKVAATFHQRPLFEAIYALSDLTGASIVIDPRVNERVFIPVSATFGHDTSLESALTLLTDSAGLRFAVIGDGIYVSTLEHADELRYLPKN